MESLTCTVTSAQRALKKEKKKRKEKKKKKKYAYIDAIMVEELIGLEFVRRVILISGQELTPTFAVNIGRCRHIEGETRHDVDTSEATLFELRHLS